MQEVMCHSVREQRITQALEDISGRTLGRWKWLRYGGLSLKSLQEMRDELLDHVAARTFEDPTLSTVPSRMVLRTAAECALGVLDLGTFPDGDFEISFPLIDKTLSSDDFEGFSFANAVDQAPTTKTWLDAFAMCLLSGAVWERDRVIGLLLRNDYAPAIRNGVPDSPLESLSDPPGLAEMDVLCGYLTNARGHLPRDWPSVTLRKPDVEERVEAARRLDALGTLTPDQQLLRVLLEDDQPAFERALAGRLVQHRESAAADAVPRSLLPVATIALAALAVQVHGWELGVRSGYLPEGLLRAPEGALRANI
ncbi:immunity 49 family protein [Actinomadura rudentiformis]|uniref:Immunity 49 family protein n=1 Tax=Actinomadura rudentiformis TaxID=359158 RepID=A0A6H9Y662_9ACTN|nr:immunity 49 family protein [Actinomadura rudentiformis]KAB2337892.1 immunity 49 family protein [Actinomadura rudentiformis]